MRDGATARRQTRRNLSAKTVNGVEQCSLKDAGVNFGVNVFKIVSHYAYAN